MQGDTFLTTWLPPEGLWQTLGGEKSSQMTDPFSSVPASVLHHHFKASHRAERILSGSPPLPRLLSSLHPPKKNRMRAQTQLGEDQLDIHGLPGAASCHKTSQRHQKVMLVMSTGQNVGSGGPDSSVPLHTAPRSPVSIAQHLQPSTYSPCSPGWEAELPRAQLELLHIPIARPMLPPECKAQNICGQEGMASIPQRVRREPGWGHGAGDV